MQARSTVQFELCDWTASIATNRQMLALKEARDGPVTALAVRHILGLTLFKDGQYVEVEEIMRKLLLIEREKTSRSSPQALGCLQNLIEVLDAQWKGKEARALLGEGWVLVVEVEENDTEREVEVMREEEGGCDGGLNGVNE